MVNLASPREEALASIEQTQIIDADSHVIEPYDLWTSRISTARWGDLVPHVRWSESRQCDVWYFGETELVGASRFAYAGWGQFPPSHPPRLADACAETWRAPDRVRWMDDNGIQAQVLYPNVAGFGSSQYMNLRDRELMNLCVSAYNDFLAEYAEQAPGRFVPIAGLPFWDLDASIAELERAAEIGHRGITFSQQPHLYGVPHLTHDHWEPLWAAAEAAGMSVNFHLGSGDTSAINEPFDGIGPRAKFTVVAAQFMVGNVVAIADVIHAGICHRHPNLHFVSVESGVGWIPYALAAMDWEWANGGVGEEHPEYELLPSEYFKRQIFGCFWFESSTARFAIDELGADSFLLQTDFPHPMGLVPGPASTSPTPKDHLREHFADLPPRHLAKLMRENAARVYHLD